MNALWHSNFFIKLRSWEYWPWYIVYTPVIIYWLWLSLRARTFFFFSAANFGMTSGGIFGDSKMKILSLLPQEIVPKTLLFKANSRVDLVLTEIGKAKITFPVIVKPDVGERGTLVEKINNEQGLHNYVERASYVFQIQEYVPGPLELGIFYYRFPKQDKGVVSSVVQKEMLKIKGDGKRTLRELILRNDRAKLQLKELELRMDLGEILKKDIQKELVSIGNHCRGTTFLNGEYLINDQLVAVFDDIYDRMEGFCYGRFDLRCESIDDLYKGNFKIMELNGAASEPAHIYHPGYSLFKAYRVLFQHWKKLYQIGVSNHRDGIPYLKNSIGWSMLRDHFKTDKYTSGQLK